MMAVDFSRYKKYDTSTGYGNAAEWTKNFRAKMTGEEAEKIIQSQPETVYTILGVGKNCTNAEVKKAFRLLITQWHPDKNPDRIEEAESMSKKIIAAYTILNNKTKKQS